MLDGKELAVCRTKTSSKGRLTISLDGNDISAATIRETQLILEQALGVPSALISRALFQGQHVRNDLLEATDVQFKNELALIVPLDQWNDAAALARAKAKNESTLSSELEGKIKLRQEDLRSWEENLETLLDESRNMEKDYEYAVLKEKEAREEELSNTMGACELEALNRQMETLRTKITDMESERKSILDSEEVFLNEMAKEKDQISKVMDNNMQAKSILEHDMNEKAKDYALAQQTATRLEKMWSVDLSGSVPGSIALPSDCPVCHQPVGSNHELQRSIESEIRDAADQVASSRQLWSNAKTHLQNVSEIQQSMTREMQELDAKEKETRRQYKQRLSEVEIGLSKERENLHQVSLSVAAQAKQHDRSDWQQLNGDVVAKRTRWEYTQKKIVEMQEDIAEYREWIEQAKAENVQRSRDVGRWKETAELLSARGVQTFVLENVLALLESSAQKYLTQLSEGSLQLELTVSERVERRVFLKTANGTFVERALAALSGGQWRRCSLALQFGFIDLMEGLLRCSLSVWDEPLTHLDETGRTNVGRLLRRAVASGKFTTIVLILQDLAADEFGESFDEIDEVRRSRDRSRVCIGQDDY